ncbi:hypothetical protein VTO73DRAFT_14719 [Trametes versicolor]
MVSAPGESAVGLLKATAEDALLPPPPFLPPSFFRCQVTSGCPVAPLDHFHSFRHRPTRPPAGFQLRQ